MANGQNPMSEQSGVPGVPGSTGQAPADMFRAWMMAQMQNTQGTTRMGPSMTHTAEQPPQPQERARTDYSARDFESSGGRSRASIQDLTGSIQNLVGTVSQKLQERKARESAQVFDRFTQSVQGVQAAQAQVDESRQMAEQAVAALKENPNDQQARQRLQQAKGMLQQGSQALQQNKTILEDMFNGPKGEKHAKMLAKGFGIDDKNASTPERQQAIAAIKKSMGVGDRAAGMIAQLPQTQQLGPEGQQALLMQKAGIKPPTGGQILNAQTKAVDQTLKAEKMISDAGLKSDQIIASLPAKGLTVDRDASGNPKRAANGQLAIRNLTLDELKDNPQLAEKYAVEQERINLMDAQAKATGVRAQAAAMREQRLRQQNAMAQSPEMIREWARLVSDPMSGVTLAQVPAPARGPVISMVAASGQKISKPITPDELKRSELAHNAVLNIEEAQSIIDRRPDMFGPGGWGKTKFEYALAGGDTDAMKFLATIQLANLPAVGIHGVRGKWALEDLQKLDGNLYLNADAMRGVLGEIHRSASEFQYMGGRQPSVPKIPAGAKTATNPKTKEKMYSTDEGKTWHPVK